MDFEGASQAASLDAPIARLFAFECLGWRATEQRCCRARPMGLAILIYVLFGSIAVANPLALASNAGDRLYIASEQLTVTVSSNRATLRGVFRFNYRQDSPGPQLLHEHLRNWQAAQRAGTSLTPKLLRRKACIWPMPLCVESI
jgi:hypothetical protein